MRSRNFKIRKKLRVDSPFKRPLALKKLPQSRGKAGESRKMREQTAF